MFFSKIRARGVALAALALILGSLAGCNSDSGGTAALPPSDGKGPPPPPTESLGPDGKPKDSSAAYDTARGGKLP
jgi:hypothetical protein